ncbi:MAG: hypothetical protein ACI9UO_002594 [Nitrospinales bacterium]|jgi:hypothetical protein
MQTVSFIKTPLPKSQCVILILVLLLFSALPVWAEKDLMDEGKSDSAIKMLVFPKSLRVIESQRDEVRSIFFDSKRIRKTLLKLDPARIAPAKAGETLSDPVTRDSLRQLAKQYSEDILFIFRRKLDDTKNAIRHQGLLYLTRQNKLLALKESMSSGSGSLQEIDLIGLKNLAREAKKVLQANKFEKRQSAY